MPIKKKEKDEEEVEEEEGIVIFRRKVYIFRKTLLHVPISIYY